MFSRWQPPSPLLFDCFRADLQSSSSGMREYCDEMQRMRSSVSSSADSSSVIARWRRCGGSQGTGLVFTGHYKKHLVQKKASDLELSLSFSKFSFSFNPVEQLPTEIWNMLIFGIEWILILTGWKNEDLFAGYLLENQSKGRESRERCSLTHLGCTRLIQQMRKNANFPMKIGAIKACITLGNDSLAHREWRFLSTSGIEGFRKKPETQLTRKGCGR